MVKLHCVQIVYLKLTTTTEKPSNTLKGINFEMPMYNLCGSVQLPPLKKENKKSPIHFKHEIVREKKRRK